MRVNQRRILYQNIVETSAVIKHFVCAVKVRLHKRRTKKAFLMEAFEREYNILNEYYV